MSTPKTLIISFSGLGSKNATGQLLMDMFGLWPGEKIIQVYWAHHPLPGINGLDAAKLDKQTIP